MKYHSLTVRRVFGIEVRTCRGRVLDRCPAGRPGTGQGQAPNVDHSFPAGVSHAVSGPGNGHTCASLAAYGEDLRLSDRRHRKPVEVRSGGNRCGAKHQSLAVSRPSHAVDDLVAVGQALRSPGTSGAIQAHHANVRPRTGAAQESDRAAVRSHNRPVSRVLGRGRGQGLHLTAVHRDHAHSVDCHRLPVGKPRQRGSGRR